MNNKVYCTDCGKELEIGIEQELVTCVDCIG